MNNDTLAKVTMIKGSLRCFTYGLLALLPGIGIPFGVVALWTAGRVRGYEKQYWNAAGPYRSWGIICAAVGLIFWFGLFVLIMFNAATSNASGWDNGGYDGVGWVQDSGCCGGGE